MSAKIIGHIEETPGTKYIVYYDKEDVTEIKYAQYMHSMLYDEYIHKCKKFYNLQSKQIAEAYKVDGVIGILETVSIIDMTKNYITYIVGDKLIFVDTINVFNEKYKIDYTNMNLKKLKSL